MKTFYIRHTEYLSDLKSVEATDTKSAAITYGKWFNEQESTLVNSAIEIEVYPELHTDEYSPYKFLVQATSNISADTV